MDGDERLVNPIDRANAPSTEQREAGGASTRRQSHRRRAPTSQDVAKRAGVSRTVVSFVLNNRPHTGIPDETRQRVLRAASELGYRPNLAARSLVSGKTRTIGVVVSETRHDAYGDAFLPALLRSIDESCRGQGYRVLLRYAGDHEPGSPYLGTFREGAVDGLIVCGPRPGDRALSDLVGDGSPIVVIGNTGELNCPSVDVDNVSAGRAAVAHLLEHGYQRVAMVTNVPRGYASADARLEGYRQALADAGRAFDERLIAEGDLDEDSVRRAMEGLISRAPRPDAVFAASDQVAFSALAVLHEIGLRVPDDVALIGFDDLAFATRVHPPLSSVHVPIVDLGRFASQRLFDLIEDRPIPEWRTILPTNLVIRQSCGRHGAKGGE